MKVLIQDISKERAEEFSLVLQSAGILHMLDRHSGRFSIKVSNDCQDAALQTLNRYCVENPEKQIVKYEAADPDSRNFTGIFVAALLLTVHLSIDKSISSDAYVQTFGASARQILNGEVYRSVTALLLHADIAHLAGNMAGIALFGSVLCAGMGTGTGWLLILASGVLGNLVNAVFFQTGHLSIGASTAVFGAVGLLTAVELIAALKRKETPKKAIWTVGGGLAILSFMGAAPNSDITAHLFGFIAGIILGIIYKLLAKKRLPIAVQMVMTAFTAAIVIASWLAGMSSS